MAVSYAKPAKGILESGRAEVTAHPGPVLDPLVFQTARLTATEITITTSKLTNSSDNC